MTISAASRVPALFALLAGALAPAAQPDAEAHPVHGWDTPEEWSEFEGPILTNHFQLTYPDEFIKAGEAYFDHSASRVIFQAVKRPPEGEPAARHYSMFVADVHRSDEGRIMRLGEPVEISEPGSANTCGWFHPKQPTAVLFGSTGEPPQAENQPGYQRDSGRYRWAFPTEMNIYIAVLDKATNEVKALDVMFDRAGYVAEASWSPDGRHVLYARINEERSASLGRPDADLWVYDQGAAGAAQAAPREPDASSRYTARPDRDPHTPLVVMDGYDGGPFFAPPGPDGLSRWICYRSDRRGDNLLQLFIAELAYDDPEDPRRITGIEREVKLTQNSHVNWAPFWHPSGRFLVYATSQMSHMNYEVFAIPVFDDQGELIEDPFPVRLTHARGFDGLPVFSDDGKTLMWTAQRGPDRGPSGASSSQIWIADVDEEALFDLVFNGPGGSPKYRARPAGDEISEPAETEPQARVGG